jgi:hypothetical protein
MLTELRATTGAQARSAKVIQIVRTIISAYDMATQGLRNLRFDEGLDPAAHAQTEAVKDNPRQSDVTFGPAMFTKHDYAFIVHTVAHELEHVRQNLIGGYPPRAEGQQKEEPVTEFLAWVAAVLQVQNVPRKDSRGFIGGLAADQRRPPPPAMPPLSPEDLEYAIRKTAAMFQQIPPAYMKPQYKEELAGASARVLERLRTEAPRLLRPPARDSPQFQAWLTGSGAPNQDPFSPEFQEWLSSQQGPWFAVKAAWKLLNEVGSKP